MADSSNAIAAVASFIWPGLGQLMQGKVILAIVLFCAACLLWLLLLGWIIHLVAACDAATHRVLRRVG